MKKIFSKLWPETWPFLIIIALVLTFFYPVWLENKIPLPADFVVSTYFPWLDYGHVYKAGFPKNPLATDVVSFMFPMQMLAIDLLKSGEWPLWNPYILAGTPLLANFQSAPFSPTNFVYFLFDTLTGWSLQVVLQHLLAGVFCYLLLRCWSLSRFPAILGGFVFAFSGFNVIWSEWNGHALSAAFVPLLVLASYLWFKTGKFVWGLVLSFGLGLQILSGYPQVVLYSFLCLSILWLFYCFREYSWLIKTVLWVVFLVLGISLASFQILPGVELLSYSQREIEPHPYDWAFLPFSKIVTFVAPDYYGNHSSYDYWGPQDYTSNVGFVGVIAVSLALIAAVKPKKETVFAIVIAVSALLLSLPTPVSIFLWQSGFLGFQAASAHRALVLFNFSIAILAGFGSQMLLAQKHLRMYQTLIIWILLVFFLGTTLYFYFSTLGSELEFVRGIPKYAVGLKNLLFPLFYLLLTTLTLLVAKKFWKARKMAFAFLFLLMSVELFSFHWKWNPFSSREIVYPKTPVFDFLSKQEKPYRISATQVVPINLRMPYKLESLEGYDAVYPLNISEVLSSVNHGKGTVNRLGRYGSLDNDTIPFVGFLNNKYHLVIKKNADGVPSDKGSIPEKYSNGQYKVVFEDKSVAVVESLGHKPRAYMVYTWQKEEDLQKRLDLIVNSKTADSVVVEEDIPIQQKESTRNSVSYLDYKDQGSLIKIETDKEGLLFVSETWYPGWHVFIDGIEARIYKANHAFRAVIVSTGEHIVEFKYYPDSFDLGLKISALSFAIIITLFAVGMAYLKRYTNSKLND